MVKYVFAAMVGQIFMTNKSPSRYNVEHIFFSLLRIIHPDKDCILFSNRISFQTFETFA